MNNKEREQLPFISYCQEGKLNTLENNRIKISSFFKKVKFFILLENLDNENQNSIKIS